jgi:hypothetical protein
MRCEPSYTIEGSLKRNETDMPKQKNGYILVSVTNKTNSLRRIKIGDLLKSQIEQEVFIKHLQA